jgi:hypothetical protein
MTRVLRVFVGSSGRAKLAMGAAAKELQDALKLQDVGPVTVEQWDLGQPAGTIIETLIARTEDSDFSLFVIGPDESLPENVLFELGLFIGALGRSHTFMLLPEAMISELPSDLGGEILHTYEPPEENRNSRQLRDRVRAECHAIASLIGEIVRSAPAPEPSRLATPVGSDLLAIEVFGNLQSGRLQPAAGQSNLLGRSVIHSDFGIGRVVSGGTPEADNLVVVRFGPGPMSVPVAELFLTAPAP